MSTWQQDLRNSFGLADRKFAGHPSDLRTAHEMLGKLIAENIGMSEVEAEVRKFLAGNMNLHVDEQVDRVRKFLEVWLDD
ncbi:hypothetical protein KM176_20850 [Pseudooceanicola sp. CBS1P-1]|uniref:Uncharacterized protein n=1 Tax=Pseudooceanicola albus TaxID=2692189 RepID=A0A6L7GAS3_9RHOB|nr:MULTISPECIES: ribose-phosphate pyrophosphokinase-like domain-containing protein [Pseudooceanicola]MBT9386331.1 hypothetical protein [Pseudooceanicola endophyticus]MXN20380.1 hypothetical protein [Pseudooceanicola albus]